MTCPKSVEKTNRINFDLPQVSKMNINFELHKVSKVTSFQIYFQSWRNWKHQIWTAGKRHQKGSTGSSDSGGSGIISSSSCDKCLYLELQRGYYQIWAVKVTL